MDAEDSIPEEEDQDPTSEDGEEAQNLAQRAPKSIAAPEVQGDTVVLQRSTVALQRSTAALQRSTVAEEEDFQSLVQRASREEAI